MNRVFQCGQQEDGPAVFNACELLMRSVLAASRCQSNNGVTHISPAFPVLVGGAPLSRVWILHSGALDKA